MMPLFHSILTAAAAAVVVLLPGAIVAKAFRLRGMLLWAFGPAAGVATLAVTATVLGFIGVAWSPLTAVAGATLLAIAAWAIALVLKAPDRTPTVRARRWVFPAMIVGALAGAVRMAMIIGEPDNVSQTNDATFHLNALRYIADTGSASSLDLLGTTGSSGFYPAAWHAVASLTMQLTGADVATAANATSLAIAGPIWTVSLAGLVWATTHSGRVTAVAALLAPTLFAFPFHMLDFGVLYPYALALAILPGVIAVLVGSGRGAPEGRGSRSGALRAALRTTLVSLVGLAALGLSQPSALLVWVLAAVAWGLVRICAPWGSLPTRQRLWRAIACAALVAGAGAVWLAMVAISSDNLWPAVRNLPDAAARMLVNGSVGAGPSIVLSVFAIIGFVIALRVARLRWLALFGVALALLVVVAQSVQNDTVRMLLSPWYADPRRFTAMMPLVVIPFAGIGVVALMRWERWRNARAGVLAGLAIVLLVYVETVAWAVINPIEHRYGETEVSYLSADERALLDDLDQFVEPDARIIGNPSAGAAFGYGLSGADVVPRTWAMPGGNDFRVLADELVDLNSDADVCPAVRALGVEYVLDFGESEEGPGKWDMPGMTGFVDGDGFDLVAERGAASLWRITGCD